MCEITIDKNRKGPSADWLKIAITNHARCKIKEALRKNKRSFFPSFMDRNK